MAHNINPRITNENNDIITKEIITAHNENINVISTPGEGTEFIFSLTPSEKNDEEE